MNTPPDEQVYFTLITSPTGFDTEDIVALLSRAAGWDEHSLRILAKRSPPSIWGSYPRSKAARAVEAIVGAGGDAFAPSLGDINNLGETLKIKEMALEDGMLQLNLWRGPPALLKPQSIQIVIRAKVSEQLTDNTCDPLVQSMHDRLMGKVSGMAATGWAFGGAYGLAAGLYFSSSQDHQSTERSITSSDKLDLHTADGRVFQVDGDKFGYGILGDRRGYSDHVNIDRMCELMTHLAPQAVIDPYFSYWHAPADCQRLRIPRMLVNNDDAEFAFYSRWAALMYRHVMGMDFQSG